MSTRICPQCGAVNAGDRDICFKCEELLIEKPVEVSRGKASSTSFVIQFLLVVMIVGVLGAIAIPNFHTSSPRPRYRSCIANIKVLENALEIYDMDTPPTIEGETTVVCRYNVPEPTVMYPLLDLGYVLRLPVCPTTKREDSYTVCRDPGEGYALYVTCTVHGTISMPRPD